MAKRLMTGPLQGLVTTHEYEFGRWELGDGWLPTGGRARPAPTQAYIVLVEEGQVADDTDPDEQRRGAQEDAADIVAGQVLGVGAVSTTSGWGMWPQVGIGGGSIGAKVWKGLPWPQASCGQDPP